MLIDAADTPAATCCHERDSREITALMLPLRCLPMPPQLRHDAAACRASVCYADTPLIHDASPRFAAAASSITLPPLPLPTLHDDYAISPAASFEASRVTLLIHTPLLCSLTMRYAYVAAVFERDATPADAMLAFDG